MLSGYIHFANLKKLESGLDRLVECLNNQNSFWEFSDLNFFTLLVNNLT